MVQVMELENGNIVHFEWQSEKGSLYDLNEDILCLYSRRVLKTPLELQSNGKH